MNLIKRFLLFFILTAVFPSLILGSFLFEESNAKLNERFANLLSTAQLLISERLEDDLDKLELVNNQATLLSINDEFQRYLQNGERAELEATLNKFQELRNLGIVALLNYQNEVIASTDTFEEAPKASLRSLIEIASKGQSVSSIERLKFESQTESLLMYVAVSPIFSETNPRKLIGTLLIGQSLRENNSFDKLLRALPILKVRVLDSPPPKFKASGKVAKNAEKMQKHRVNLKYVPQFQEQIDGEKYLTALIPLRNYSHETVGYLAVSLSKHLEEDLKEKNSILLGLFMFLAFAGILLSGLWFNRSFLVPLTAVAEACSKVAAGDLKVQINTSKTKGEIRHTLKNFNHMLVRLQENEEMRSTFISTLTHDLRTPLLAQGRVYELLAEEFKQTESQALKLLDGLNANNAHLLNMVDLLVQTYQLEAGQITLEKQNVNLRELVAECLSSLQPLITAKQIESDNLIPEDFPPLFVDPFQFKRVLLNLIGNAIENLPQGRRIEVSAKEEVGRVQLTIWDNGIGIPPNFLPQIFERYVSRTRTKQKIGSGLGLYICRMIVEAHEGTISVESEVDSYTLFRISLPKPL